MKVRRVEPAARRRMRFGRNRLNRRCGRKFSDWAEGLESDREEDQRVRMEYAAFPGRPAESCRDHRDGAAANPACTQARKIRVGAAMAYPERGKMAAGRVRKKAQEAALRGPSSPIRPSDRSGGRPTGQLCLLQPPFFHPRYRCPPSASRFSSCVALARREETFLV